MPADREVAFEDLVRGRVSFHSSVIGDPVLLRSDGHPAYNFAVVVDDALMAVTHVVRGEDHISNTPRQILIYEALGLTPPRFAHLALVMGPDHTPLSKRHGATSVAEFRARGYLPEALVNYLALIGWSPGGEDELLPAEELARRFRIEAVGHSAGVFDEEKLAWVDRHYLRTGDPARLAQLALPYFRRRDSFRSCGPRRARTWRRSCRWRPGRWTGSTASPPAWRFLFRFDAAAALARAEVQEVLAHEGAAPVIESLARELSRRVAPGGPGSFPRRGQRREAADRAEGKAVVPPDPGCADRGGRRPGARRRGAGDRPRRRSCRPRRASRRLPGAARERQRLRRCSSK